MKDRSRYSDAGATCAVVTCDAPVEWMLLPGHTGHCPAHGPSFPHYGNEAWRQAFAVGAARWVAIDKYRKEFGRE